MKIKVGFGIWIVIAIIFGALFLSDYSKQSTSANLLSDKILADSIQINNINLKSKDINKDIEVLNANVAKTQAEIVDAGRIIPESLNSNEVIKALFSQGALNQVELVPLTTEEWTTVNIESAEVNAFKIAFLLRGGEAKVIQTIKWIQDSPYSTLVIKDFSLSDINDPQNPDVVEARINIVIYAK
jgi:hypothetical protein